MPLERLEVLASVAAHLLQGTGPTSRQGTVSDARDGAWTLDEQPQIEARFPKYADGRVCVNRHVWLDGVSPDVWSFTIGGHQVCRKWLKDRRGRMLTDAEREAYGRMILAIADTARCVTTIDSAIRNRGGWVDAFLPVSPGN